jgi:hypothetical protein
VESLCHWSRLGQNPQIYPAGLCVETPFYPQDLPFGGFSEWDVHRKSIYWGKKLIFEKEV